MTGIWSSGLISNLALKISKSESKTLALLQQAYGEHSMQKSSVFE